MKLMSEESCAADPCNIPMSDYSSVDSSEADYTEPDSDQDPYFLFNNVRKLPRRRRRKIPLEDLKRAKEKKKYEFSSDSDSSESEYDYQTQKSATSSHRRFHNSNYLSDLTDDEDAIHFNVMRDFARLENARGGSLNTSSFSASACQKIHKELLESVNQIYKDMKRKPLLKRNAISTSSIAHSRPRAPALANMGKSKSIELKTESGRDRSNRQRRQTLVPDLEAKRVSKKPNKVATVSEDKKKSKGSPSDKKEKKKASLSVAAKMSLLKIQQKA